MRGSTVPSLGLRREVKTATGVRNGVGQRHCPSGQGNAQLEVPCTVAVLNARGVGLGRHCQRRSKMQIVVLTK